MFVIVNFRRDSSGHIKKKPSYQLGFHALHYVYLINVVRYLKRFSSFPKAGMDPKFARGGTPTQKRVGGAPIYYLAKLHEN